MSSRLARCALLIFAAVETTAAGTYEVRGVDAKPWSVVLGSVGMTAVSANSTVIVVPGSAPAETATLASNRILIVEGFGTLAASLGVNHSAERISVRQTRDVHAADLPVYWEQPLELPRAEIADGFKTFVTEKWKNAPLVAGRRTPHGGVLWLATSPGASGIERFPYLLEALADLGWQADAGGTDLWAFFDSAYRIRADPDYLARRWRRAGIAALHAAAWHNMEPDAARDAYLRSVIEACHRNAISVYAWLELPHVSERFWAEHPAWREKTAVGQDAQLDWRKLMNLQNPDCRQAVAALLANLVGRFDWDGVNLAELYFESLEGAANPARFTPMNDDVRAAFKQQAGFDPQLLFTVGSPYTAATHPAELRKFLDYRATLAVDMQRSWLQTLTGIRATKPYLDLVLTHIDDRFEPGIRDSLGADVARSLPALAATRSTLLVEDPATMWALGPERYTRLAERYSQIAPPAQSALFGIDINVVERYQDVYPTKKQTGVELLSQVHQAAVSFGRVALYFENSLEKQDLPLLSAASTSARVTQRQPDELEVEARETTRIAWNGPVAIDGKAWPVAGDGFVLAPAGRHKISLAFAKPPVLLRDFNGEIRSTAIGAARVDLAYQSRTRAIATLASNATAVEIDGEHYNAAANAGASILLPAGQHIVSSLK